MRRHVVSHWRVWVVIAICVIAINEVMDRSFFDHREHIDGDVVVTAAILLIAISVSYGIARARRRPATRKA
jgi:purine-cytosine permease-like protein